MPTISSYLKLLSDAFLLTSLDKYYSSAYKSGKSSPKLVIHDNALLRSLERPLRADINSERFGRYFENTVLSRFVEAGWEVFYWAERKMEVDMIALGHNGEKWAVETKSSRITKSDLKGLFHFCSRHKSFVPC